MTDLIVFYFRPSCFNFEYLFFMAVGRDLRDAAGTIHGHRWQHPVNNDQSIRFKVNIFRQQQTIVNLCNQSLYEISCGMSSVYVLAFSRPSDVLDNRLPSSLECWLDSLNIQTNIRNVVWIFWLFTVEKNDVGYLPKTTFEIDRTMSGARDEISFCSCSNGTRWFFAVFSF